MLWISVEGVSKGQGGTEGRRKEKKIIKNIRSAGGRMDGGRNKCVGTSSTLVWCSVVMGCTDAARGIRANETYASPTKGRPACVHSQHLYLIFQGSRLPFRVLRPQILYIPRTFAIPFLFLFSLLFFFNRRCSSVSSLHLSSTLFISISSYLPSFPPSLLIHLVHHPFCFNHFHLSYHFAFFLFIVNISCIITSIACTPHSFTSINTRTRTQNTNGRFYV